ncbi:MAG: phosphoglucosamine mutase [Planctomycetota bacterium]
MSKLIISVSGLRGIVGDTLTPDIACRYAAAFAASLPATASDEDGGAIVVGRDGRSTGGLLGSAVISALNASGRDVIDAGVAATPTIGVLVRETKAAGGIQISASHNPPPYNGIKLFGAEGRVLDAISGTKVRDSYQEGLNAYVPHDQIGQTVPHEAPHVAHLNKVLKVVNPERVLERSYSVLLDSNHGAGGTLGLRLLEALGCQVTTLGVEPSGNFAHMPEPTRENLITVGRSVSEHRCQVGFCQDPDADRLALIDETGRYIGEECTLALCVQRAMMVGRTDGPIVINGATSGMSEIIAKEHGVVCHRSAVGEANVADEMIASGAIFGGEGNGGPIDPDVGYVRDSFVAMAQVLELMAMTGKTLSQLADELPKLSIHKEKVDVDPEHIRAVFDHLESHFQDAKADRGDGLRLQWDDAWLLVRGSNTEPIVRMIAETKTAEASEKLCATAAEMIRAAT